MSNTTNTENKSLKNKITGIGLVFWVLYLFATIFPDNWWGLHFVSFLPPFLSYGFLGLSLLSILYFHFNSFRFEVPNISNQKPMRWALLVAGVMTIIYFNLPIHESVYGDSELFQEKLGERTVEYKSKYVRHLLEVDFTNPKLGNTTVLSGVRLLSYGFGISHQQAFRLIGAFSGFWFVFIVILFLNKNIRDKQLQLLFALITVLAPFSQLFMGYEEIYAVAFPAVAAYFYVLFNSFKQKKPVLLLYLLVLLVLSLKFHTVFILLAPSLLLATLYQFRDRFRWVNSFFIWKRVALFILLPILLVGTYAYFFIFKDYNDPRFLGPEVDIYSRLFLPIVAPEAPLDRYTLFSWNHIFDYFNMNFLWSGGALFILLVSLLFFKKKVKWNKPEVIVFGLTFILFFIIYFAYNPLMSMPIDFDLFSLPALSLLFFVFVIGYQIEGNRLSKYIGGTTVALTLLTCSIYLVNSDETSLSYRMESVGKNVFKSYWIRSAGDINIGIEMLSNDKDLYIDRYLNVIEELEPYAIKGKDKEYAILLWQVAIFYRKELKDYEKALAYHKKAQTYYENLEANYIGLMESCYYLGDYIQAYGYSQNLISFNYPDEKKALRIAIDCAMQANLLDEAQGHVKVYLSKWNDQDILILNENIERLKKGDTKENIVALNTE